MWINHRYRFICNNVCNIFPLKVPGRCIVAPEIMTNNFSVSLECYYHIYWHLVFVLHFWQYYKNSKEEKKFFFNTIKMSTFVLLCVCTLSVHTIASKYLLIFFLFNENVCSMFSNIAFLWCITYITILKAKNK